MFKFVKGTGLSIQQQFYICWAGVCKNSTCHLEYTLVKSKWSYIILHSF